MKKTLIIGFALFGFFGFSQTKKKNVKKPVKKTYVKKKSPGIPKNQGSLNFDNPADPYVLPEVNPIDSF